MISHDETIRYACFQSIQARCQPQRRPFGSRPHNAAADPVAGKVCIASVERDVILATLGFKGSSWLLKPSKAEARPIIDAIEIWAIVEARVRFKV